MENNKRSTEEFDWETEEGMCDIDFSIACESNAGDSSKSIASRSTGCSEKMHESPLRQKGQIKIDERERFLEELELSQPAWKPKNRLYKRDGKSANSLDELTRPKGVAEASRWNRTTSKSTSQMTHDIKFLLREMAKNKQNQEFLSKSSKNFESAPRELDIPQLELPSPDVLEVSFVTVNDIEALN